MKSFAEWTRDLAERNNKQAVVEEAPPTFKGLDLGNSSITGTVIWPVHIDNPIFDIEDVSYTINNTTGCP